MRAKINVPILGKRSVSATAETTTSLQQAKRSSRFKVLLVWMIVLLPLAWGIYVTGQTVDPLIRTLLSRSH